MQNIHVNYVAVLVSVVASFAIGSLWYGPLFGRAWSKAMNFPEDWKPSGGDMVKGFLLSILGTAMTAVLLAHEVAVWRPSTWNAPGADAMPLVHGFSAGLMTWMGYFVPVLLNSVAFERRSWKVFGLSAGYYFFSLQAIGLILAVWK